MYNIALDLHPIMQVHYQELGELPKFRKAVVTIGTFDGVHLGHRQIIEQLISEAKSIGGETVIISFYPHPRSVISKQASEVKLLSIPAEKIVLLADAGVDHLVIVPFNQDFANQLADSYITDFLIAHFNPHTIIIGYDHRFGKNRSGDYHLLVAYGKKLGFQVKEIPEHLLNEVVISSTKIRHALLNAEIETANKYLGYAYFFEGLIIKGNQLGRTLGFPTANLFIENPEKLIPGNGVYAVTAMVLGETEIKQVLLKGMMNIGVRPTIDGVQRVIEVNLFNFDKDIYGKRLKVFVHYHLRNEQKFSGLEALKTQLGKDQEMAKQALTAL